MGKLIIKEGKARFLREKNATAIVEFDWKDTTWERKESFEAFCGSAYDARVDSMNREFVKVFNKKSPGLKIVDEDSADYKVVVTTDALFRRVNKFVFIPGSFHIEVFGRIEVYKMEDDSLVCDIKVSELDGTNSMNPTSRLVDAFRELAEQFADL